MRPFVVNGRGRLVFPSNFSAELDFSVIETLEQLEAVVKRDFEAEAPTGTEPAPRTAVGGPRAGHAAPPHHGPRAVRPHAPPRVAGGRQG